MSHTCKQCGTENEIPWNWPAGDLCPACAHLKAKMTDAQPQVAAADFRTLKATIPRIEFGALQWAAKRSLVRHPNGKMGAMNLDTFLRLALLDKLRTVVREEIARGKPVPPDIAAVLDQRP